MTLNRFTMGARLKNGKSFTMTLIADSYQQASRWLAIEILKTRPYQRGVVLTCITGGKP